MSGPVFTPATPAASSATKAGVIQLSQHVSCTYAVDNIRVNSVLPGLTATPLIASMYTLDEQDVAGESR